MYIGLGVLPFLIPENQPEKTVCHREAAWCSPWRNDSADLPRCRDTRPSAGRDLGLGRVVFQAPTEVTTANSMSGCNCYFLEGQMMGAKRGGEQSLLV